MAKKTAKTLFKDYLRFSVGVPLRKHPREFRRFIRRVHRTEVFQRLQQTGRPKNKYERMLLEIMGHRVLYAAGKVIWMKNGKIHRDFDLPAVIGDGRIEYFTDGLRHRGNGRPAVIDELGILGFYESGKLSRSPGLPALVSGMDGIRYSYRGVPGRPGDLPAIVSESAVVFMEDGEVSRDPKNGPSYFNIVENTMEHIRNGRHVPERSIVPASGDPLEFGADEPLEFGADESFAADVKN